MYSVKDISEYIVALIAAFASRYDMTDMEAYKYLRNQWTTWFKACGVIAIGKEARYDTWLSGLRGFSAMQMKETRLFYEDWKGLDSIS